MGIAATVQHHLDQHHARYEVQSHRPTTSSLHTAHTAHVSGNCLAKSVLLEDDRGFMMAVVPASHTVDLSMLSELTGRHLHLARESAFQPVFGDCALGAIPPLGPIYGVETLLDERLADAKEVWFEAGDHKALIHMAREEFLALLPGVMRADISRPLNPLV